MDLIRSPCLSNMLLIVEVCLLKKHSFTGRGGVSVHRSLSTEISVFVYFNLSPHPAEAKFACQTVGVSKRCIIKGTV